MRYIVCKVLPCVTPLTVAVKLVVYTGTRKRTYSTGSSGSPGAAVISSPSHDSRVYCAPSAVTPSLRSADVSYVRTACSVPA